MQQISLPLFGGILISLASTIMLAGIGRITGISGILSSSVLARPEKNQFWRYSFLAGLILGGLIVQTIAPSFFHYKIESSTTHMIVAGLLVGFGTSLGNGCTSGHGVCGLARLAKRSFVATFTFIVFGMITVFIQRSLL